MKKTPKKAPEFASDREEITFWEKNDVTDYFDFKKAKRTVFPNLKPSTETISLRLPENLLNGIKTMANRNDIPYQSLIKIMLAERLRESLRFAEPRYRYGGRRHFAGRARTKKTGNARV